MIDNKIMSIPLLIPKSKNHELNNEGCRCPICQKVNLTANSLIVQDKYHDRFSEEYHPHDHKQSYLELVHAFVEWQKLPRKLRFSLPETCVFERGMPVYWVTKNKDSTSTKIIRNRLKMNMFEIQHFLLEGYLNHNPEVLNKKHMLSSFKQRARQDCIVGAKYQNNTTQLLTLDQMQSLFKSKYKYMRDGLMYLQTLVGGPTSKQVIVKIDIEQIEKQHSKLYERAKYETRIFVGEIKITDGEYQPEKDEIHFQKSLKHESMQNYLTYVSLKIIFIESKMKPNIIKRAVFKWTYTKTTEFLWDLRVVDTAASSIYWQDSSTYALEVKLKKTMSMLEMQPGPMLDSAKISLKGRQMSDWLQKSTEHEWNEMRAIRSRLEKLEAEKKSLQQTQRMSNESGLNRSFRAKSLLRRDTLNKTFNMEASLKNGH